MVNGNDHEGALAVMEADKTLGSQTLALLRRQSVTELPDTAMGAGGLLDEGLAFFLSDSASDIVRWGQAPTVRDRQLREFITLESVTASAFSSVVARNAAFSWTLDGPEEQVDASHEMLLNANMGAGWLNFITKLAWDVLTQDKGGFFEIIRIADSPEAPVAGIQTLDSVRCWHTGDPETPVLYMDRKGKWHGLKWFQVVTISEMPTADDKFFGLQYCALTRVLKAAQIFRNIQVYMDEKTGGRHTRAIQIVSGVKKSELVGALASMHAAADEKGQLRYMQPLILTTLRADVKPEMVTIELASLPDSFDAEKEFQRFLTVMSMGLLTDFQELAPLPGGGIGSGAQSEILHLKSRGKGPGLWQKLITHALNFNGVLPRGVQFMFDEQDLEAETAEAEIAKKRAETRAVQVASGELDAAGARQIALDKGDIPEELFIEMNQRDLTGPAPRSDTRLAEDDDPDSTGDAFVEEGVRALVAQLVSGTKQSEDGGTSLSDFLMSRIHRAFTIAADDMRALGYMDTPERIKISGLIGGVLSSAEQVFGEEAGDIMRRNLETDDQRILVSALKELNEDLAGPSEERLAFEEETVIALGPAFAQMQREVEEILRKAAE